MAKLLIIYHSQSGNTEAMAKAVYQGALSSGATASLKKQLRQQVMTLLIVVLSRLARPITSAIWQGL